jgi:hypothetical protein
MEHVSAVCKWSGIDFSKEKRTPHILLQFETVNGETLYGQLWLTEGGYPNTEKVLRGVFGWFDPDNDVSIFYDRWDLLNDIEVDLAYEVETYNGKQYKKIKFINPAGGGRDAVTQMTREEAVALGASLKGKFMLDAQKRRQEAAAQGGAAPAKPGAPKPAADVSPKPAATPAATPASAPATSRFTPSPKPAVPPPDDDLPF